MTPASYQNRYLKRKLAGLCTDCGAQPASEEHNYCDRCRAARSAAHKRHYRSHRTPSRIRCGGCGVVGHSIRLCPKRGLA